MNVKLETAMRAVLDEMVPDQPIGMGALCKKVGLERPSLRHHIYRLVDAGWVTYEPEGRLTDKTKFRRVKERLIVPQQRSRRRTKQANNDSEVSFLELCRQYEAAQLEVDRLKGLIVQHVARKP